MKSIVEDDDDLLADLGGDDVDDEDVGKEVQRMSLMLEKIDNEPDAQPTLPVRGMY